jgi:peptidylprolyl isomerase/peptidyl-prolyl cis-trans isomerase D
VQVQAEQSYISGIGNSRQLRNFMETSDEGDVSTVVELDNMFVVARLAEIQPEGYRSFEEVRTEIEPRAKLEKKKEVQRGRMESAYANSGYDGLASALGVTERVVTGVTYDTRSVAELGSDPVFKGTVLSMNADQTSGIIEGTNAVFVVRVTGVTEPTPITDAEKTQLRTQLSNQLKTQATRQWLTALRDKADITDNRRFFAQ